MIPERIIHIIDNLQQVNFGIWNAAVATAPYFSEKKIITELWFPKPDQLPKAESLNHVQMVQLDGSSYAFLRIIIKERNLDPKRDVIITHGTWQYPTKWGKKLKSLGFHWIYTPHGMLEPFDRKRKWLKKMIYFNLFEKTWARKADTVRAVAQPEKNNLLKYFPNVVHIPNGIDEVSSPLISKSIQPIIFLYMARLHAKKGIKELLEAWKQSSLFQDRNYQLIIAGPDDGQKAFVESFISQAGAKANMKYVGAIYGEEKIKLLSKSSFYILPSYSEGFPTSVLEAMQFKNVCLITDGCNFPEAILSGVAIHISPEVGALKASLDHIKTFTSSDREELGAKAEAFVLKNYSLKQIAEKQLDLFLKCK
ncbi:MAG TPA: glycosyltransferase [Cytophagaceae bacterium]|jgi:glycosyltransferase involved in cell wall biosynthesis